MTNIVSPNFFGTEVTQTPEWRVSKGMVAKVNDSAGVQTIIIEQGGKLDLDLASGSNIVVFEGLAATDVGVNRLGSEAHFYLLSTGETIASIPVSATSQTMRFTDGDKTLVSGKFNNVSIVADSTGPSFVSASVNGTSLVLNYDEELNGASLPNANAFTIKVSGVALASNAYTVTGVSGKQLNITLNSTVAVGVPVTVAYTDPSTGNDVNAVQDVKGNDAASLAETAVANAPLDTSVPVLLAAKTSADGTKIVLDYSESLSATTASASAFTVKVNNVAATVSSVAINGQSVQLNLGSVVHSGDAVTVAYADPTVGNDANAVQDAAGNDVLSIALRSVVNAVPATYSPLPSKTNILLPNFFGTEVTQTPEWRVSKGMVAKVNDSAGVQTIIIEQGGKLDLDLASGSNIIVFEGLAATDVGVNRLGSEAHFYLLSTGETIASIPVSATSQTMRFTDGDKALVSGKFNNVSIVADSTGPAFMSASVNGTSLVLNYDEELNGASLPNASAFTIKVNGIALASNAYTVTGVSGKQLNITLNSAVAVGVPVTVAYTDPSTGNDVNAVQDVKGNDAASLAETAVANAPLDTTAPAAPVITTASSTTNSTTETIAGTAEANSIVSIYDGSTLLGTATTNGSGAFSYSATGLSQAAHSITAKATDAAGNVSPASTAITLTVDTAAPSAPVITTVSSTTNSTTQTIAGTAEANSVVSIYDGENLLGTATANGSGAFSYSATGLSQAAHTITAKATDAAGNVSPASTAITLTVDTTPPTIGIASDKSSLTAGQTATVTFTLSEASTDFTSADVAVAGGTLSNFTGSGSSYSATFTPTANSTTAGSISVASSKFSDAAGNQNADGAEANNTVALSIDTTTAQQPITVNVANGQTYTATSGADTFIIDANSSMSATISGFASGDKLQIVNGSQAQGVNFTDSGYGDATTTLTAGLAVITLTNLATDGFAPNEEGFVGQFGANSIEYAAVSDTTAPSAPVITTASATTNSTTQTIAGTAEANSVVSIYDGSTLLGTATANGSGAFSYSATGLSQAAHSITAKATDAAGNVSAASTAIILTVDTAAPTIGIASDKASLTEGQTATVTFTLSEASTDFTSADIAVVGGTLSNFTGSGTSYSATFTPTANSTTAGSISVASSKFSDAAGNQNTDGAEANNTVALSINTIPVSSVTVVPSATTFTVVNGGSYTATSGADVFIIDANTGPSATIIGFGAGDTLEIVNGSAYAGITPVDGNLLGELTVAAGNAIINLTGLATKPTAIGEAGFTAAYGANSVKYDLNEAEAITLYAINQLRHAPTTWATMLGVNLTSNSAGTANVLTSTDVAAKDSLVADQKLFDAALGHSVYMLTGATPANPFAAFDHLEGTNISAPNYSPSSRETAAGYIWSASGENINMQMTGSGPYTSAYAIAMGAVSDLFVDTGITTLGHRKSLLSASYADVGVGYALDNVSTGGYSYYGTENFGANASEKPHLTGFALKNIDGNFQFNDGDGLAGVAITITDVTDNKQYTTLTQAYGYWDFEGVGGHTYNISASGSGFTGTGSVTGVTLDSGGTNGYNSKSVDFFSGTSWGRVDFGVDTNHAATGSVTISGTQKVGNTLTADTSTIADADGIGAGALNYQWFVDGVAMSGVTSSSIALDNLLARSVDMALNGGWSSGDTAAQFVAGHKFSVSVSYTDQKGALEALPVSALTGVIQA